MSAGEDKKVASKGDDVVKQTETKIKDESKVAAHDKSEDKSFPSEASTEVLVNESDESITPENLEKTEDEAFKTSKDNESSVKLELEVTPEVITKIPESQDLYIEDSIVERSHPSTIEICSVEIASKETLSFSECEGSKHTPHHSSGKHNIFGKSQEDEHSLQISQDDLFGSHASVVASTPQSDFNSRALLQKKGIKSEVDDDVEMIPSSPEEKRSKSAVLPLNRELSLGRTTMRIEPSSSPDVMEITEEVNLVSPELDEVEEKKKETESNTAGKRRIDFGSVECQGLESQETICSSFVEKMPPDPPAKESSGTSPVEELKETKSSGSTDVCSMECGQKFDDDFDTEPVAALDQYPMEDDSQEVEKETQDGLSGDNPSENGSKRPKCGLKRKIKDIKLVTAKDLILGRRDSSDEETEVEVLEVKKKPRKSVEVVYSKPLPKNLKSKYTSPSKTSSSYSSSSSSSSISPKKSYIPRKGSLKSLFEAAAKTAKAASEPEDFIEEDFTLHMSPSGSLDMKIGSPAKLPPEKDGKICGTMSTIMEVDEAGTSTDESTLVKATKGLEVEEDQENVDVTTKNGAKTADKTKVLGRMASLPSPEYLPDDDVDNEILTGIPDVNDKDVEIEKTASKGEKLTSNENCSNGHLSDHSKDSPNEDTTLKETKTISPEDSTGKKEKDNKIDSNTDQSHKTAELQRWLYVHVSHKYDVESGDILSTKILEIQCPDESIKNSSKERICGRISDVSKASSVDSKSSACLGDVSSPPNAASPQSVSGDAKLFSLPPTRISIMSTFSHSSSSTSGSDLVINVKAKDKATFTKPSNPPTMVKEKGLNLVDLSPDLKALTSKDSDVVKELSRKYSKQTESVMLDIEQAIQGHTLNVKDLMSKEDTEDRYEGGLPMIRHLMKKTPKGKRLPLRLKKKSSTSSKTASPSLNSPENSRNTDEMDTVPIESMDESSSPLTPKAMNLSVRLTPLSSRSKSSRGRSRQLSQKKSSENLSECSSGAKSSKNSQETIKEVELPCSPPPMRDSTVPAGMITEGASVFAKFSDKWYYPGKARKQQKDDRWIIDFDDGNVKWVREEFIVVVDVLLQGQSVYAAVGDDVPEYESGIITKVEIVKCQPIYTIELDIGNTVIFPTSKLCLTEDQVKLVIELRMDSVPSTPKRKAEVSLDNVLEGRRTRGRKTTESVGPSTPCSSKSHTGHRSLPLSVPYSTSCSSEISESDVGLEDIPGIEPPDSPASSTHSCKSKGPGRRKGKSKRSEDAKEEIVERCKQTPSTSKSNELGPVPPKGSTFFKEKYFILNIGATKEVTSRKTRNRKIQSDVSSDGEGIESSEEMHFSITPFVKRHLKKQIEAGGGTVLDHYDSRCKGSNCFLISNRCNLTADYILCLAADIQSVSHDWVIKCCIEGELIPWMENLLPAGWSPERTKHVEWHERSSRSLKDVEIVLASDSGNKFLEFWRRVLTTAGANVRKVSTKTMSPYEDISYVRVVVTDLKCPEGIVARANEAGIPMVSTYWVQQSLIHGKMRPFDAHPSYKYDYVHSD